MPVVTLAPDADDNPLEIRYPKTVALNPNRRSQAFWFSSVPFGPEYIGKVRGVPEEARRREESSEIGDMIRSLDATYLEGVSAAQATRGHGTLTFVTLRVAPHVA
jgi:hypothetical protein